jgi:nitroimidazol reductase NimA-like FMN-containing flavoprotein (pyridoxamine 5'-phosphate oxidase superfamily)
MTKLLTSNKSLARICTVSNNGAPHVVPVWFLFRNGLIHIPTPSRTLKARNAITRPQVSVVIDEYTGKLRARGILISGEARLITGKKSSNINYFIHKKYMGRQKVKQKKWKEFMKEDDATIIVAPSKIKSWDFSNLRI